MYRIYTTISGNAIKSNKRCNNFLSLLKLRTIASKIGGRFYLKDAVEVLGLCERTTKRHLSQLKEVKKTKKGYKLISNLNLELSGRKKNTFVLISHDKLFSYSWKNIGEFHAYLSEIEISRYTRHKKAREKGYKVFNHKDKIFEVIKNGNKEQFHNFQAAKCSSLVVNKSMNTIFRYQKTQNESKYSSKRTGKFDSSYYNTDGSFNFEKYLLNHKGKFFKIGDSFFFQSISTRTSKLSIKFG